MKNKYLVIGNWKMYLPHKKAKLLFAKLKLSFRSQKYKNIDAVVSPSFDFLAQASTSKALPTAAQGMSDQVSGPYTGEVSVESLKQLKVKYVILGHSEMRARGETDKMVHDKLDLALQNGIIPILCVGESAAQRRAKKTDSVISSQVKNALKGIKTAKKKVVVAYEPIWALSNQSGKACDPEEADRVNGMIHSLLKGVNHTLLYGGSVNSNNILSYAGYKYIQGFLVGSASTKAKEFLQICNKLDAPQK